MVYGLDEEFEVKYRKLNVNNLFIMTLIPLYTAVNSRNTFTSNRKYLYGNTCLLNTLVKYASALAGAGEYHMQCSVYTHGATFYTEYTVHPFPLHARGNSQEQVF